MAERGVEAIRKEIAVEREGLDSDLNQLQSELRSLVPVVIAAVAVVALVTFRKGTMKGARMVWRLL